MTSARTIGVWVILIALFIAFYQVFQHSTDEEVTRLSFTSFMSQVHDQKISQVEIKGGRYRGKWPNGDRFVTEGPIPDAALLETLRNDGVDVALQPPEETSIWLTLLSQWMPVVFLFLFFVFFMRQVRGKTSALPEFKPELQTLPSPGPMASLDGPRAQLREAAANVKNRVAGPRRVLLSGPPGSGKTSLVKAAVADSGLKAYVLSSADFIEVFVGVGAQRMRRLFEEARKHQPVIVVLEDLDGIGKTRAPNLPEKSQDEREQTTIELCQWLDGLKKFPEQVLLIATTNRPDLLDPALLRPGRFELKLELQNRSI